MGCSEKPQRWRIPEVAMGVKRKCIGLKIREFQRSLMQIVYFYQKIT